MNRNNDPFLRSGAGAKSLIIAALPALVLGVVGVLYLRHESAIAEQELRNEGKRFGSLAVSQLEDAYREYLQSDSVVSRAISPDSIQLTGIPSPGSDQEDEVIYRKYLRLVSDPDGLREALPSFGAHLTPAGLPLKPIACLSLARLYRDIGNIEEVEEILRLLIAETVTSEPSVISGQILEAAEELARTLGIADRLEFDAWRLAWKEKEKTRDRFRRSGEDILRQSNITRWFEDNGERFYWTDLPNGNRIAFSKSELERLAGEALQDLWPLASTGPRSLSIRITFEEESLIPAPFRDSEFRDALFEKTGHSVIALNPSGRELVSLGSSSPYSVRVCAADWKGFRQSVTKRTLWMGGLLGIAWLGLVAGFWRTWRTLVFQHELNEQQSNLISSISHELRSPVAGIRLVAERLSKSSEDRNEQDRNYIRLVTRETERLTGLIDNILDTGRIADGRKKFELEWIDLNALLRDTVERYSLLAAEDQKKLSSTVADKEELPVFADPVAMQQAVGNLLDNALKFSRDDGEVKLTVDADETDAEVIITVSDQGHGIEARDLPRIFDLFFRSDSERRRATAGTGLGLFLVKNIADAHRGRVEVQSEVGTGSVFRLILPLYTELTLPEDWK